VTAPKAPGGGLGKTPEVDKRRRLHQQQANVANKGNVKLQEATSNENILRVIIDSPLALMEYLNELKAAGDTKKLKTAGDAVLKHYKGIANFREKLREEHQFVSKGIGSSNKGGEAARVRAKPEQRTAIAEGNRVRASGPNAAPQPIAEGNKGGDSRLVRAKPELRASGSNDKKITEVSQKAARPDYQYAGNADDNVLDNDVRNPARNFRIAFAKADEGSIFEVNGQTYRKI